MLFKTLEINREWRQFGKFQIKFHDRFTVLTGANGAGKTTILDILAARLNYHRSYLATPRFDKTGNLEWDTNVQTEGEAAVFEHPEELNMKLDPGVVARVFFSDGNATALVPNFPNVPAAEYQLGTGGTNISGVFIPSPRPAIRYEPIVAVEVPDGKNPRQRMLDLYKLHSFFNSPYRWGTSMAVKNGPKGIRCAGSLMKEGLIGAGTYGYGNKVMPENLELIKIFEGFSKLLKGLLPKEIGYIELQVSLSELVIHAEIGDFPFEAVSGGLASLLDIAWQIFLNNGDDVESVVVIDEPELHLHPGLQQVIMPKLLEAFPKVQFIIATHSPLIVTSVNDSSVYALSFRDGKVMAEALDFESKAGTANDTLRTVLGLSSTMPQWAKGSIEKAYRSTIESNGLTADSLRTFVVTLQSDGLGDYLPRVLLNAAKSFPKENKRFLEELGLNFDFNQKG